MAAAASGARTALLGALAWHRERLRRSP
jgi:uncharacterized membrane protein YgcG